MKKYLETLYCEEHDKLFSREDVCCIECLLEERLGLSDTLREMVNDCGDEVLENNLQNKLFN